MDEQKVLDMINRIIGNCSGHESAASQQLKKLQCVLELQGYHSEALDDAVNSGMSDLSNLRTEYRLTATELKAARERQRKRLEEERNMSRGCR